MSWDRKEWRVSGHPDRRVGDAYAERYREAVALGFSQVDARESATAEAERAALRIQAARRERGQEARP
jgi:hypothetical protein